MERWTPEGQEVALSAAPMTPSEERTAQEVLLDFLIENSATEEERESWEREAARRLHHRGHRWHPAPAQPKIPGVDDERALAALRAREKRSSEE